MLLNNEVQLKSYTCPDYAIKVYRENGGTDPLILNLVSIIPTPQKKHQNSKSSLLIPFTEIIAVFEIIM